MDVIGNYVDDEGRSIDPRHRVIDAADYFKSFGEITRDNQRDMEYTNMLGVRIVEEFHKINRVFSSHLVAYVGFTLLRRLYAKLDLFNFNYKLL